MSEVRATRRHVAQCAPKGSADACGPSCAGTSYGDSRSNPRIHAALANQFRTHAPDFILHTGDLVAKGTDYSLWSKEFFTPLATVIDEVPFFPVIGNHEEDGTN